MARSNWKSPYFLKSLYQKNNTKKLNLYYFLTNKILKIHNGLKFYRFKPPYFSTNQKLGNFFWLKKKPCIPKIKKEI